MKSSFPITLLTLVLLSANLPAQDSLGVRLVEHLAVGMGTYGITIEDDILYVGSYNLHTYDLANREWVSRNRYYANSDIRDINVRDGTAFLSCYSSGFKIVDVSDPASPQHLSSIPTLRNLYNSDIVGDFAYLPTISELFVVDISDAARPELVSTFYQATGHDIKIRDGYAYLAGTHFRVVDVSRPSQPQAVASFELPYYGYAVELVGDRAIIAEALRREQNIQAGIRIVDISDPENPETIGTWESGLTGTPDVKVQGNHAYFTCGRFLKILEISDADDIRETGFYESWETKKRVFVQEPLVYVTQGSSFAIYDCSNALGAPELRIADEDLAHDFGGVPVGMTRLWNFPIFNFGQLMLDIQGMACDDPAFILHCDRSRWRYDGGFRAGQIAGDQRLGGVEFVDGRFYVTGGANGDMVNQVYVFDRDGRLERRFDQFAESLWGIRDLTWDGELLWGIDGGEVFGFTTAGELVEQFRSPLQNLRYIAWDDSRELLWMADFASPIYGIDREGFVAAQFEAPAARVYGLAWHPADPDGFNLYIAGSTDQAPFSLYKLNPEFGDLLPAKEMLIPEIGSRAGGGLSITSELNSPAWQVLALLDGNPDAVEYWQLTDHYRGESLVVPAEEDMLVGVEYAPSELGDYAATLTIRSSDENLPEVEIELRGNGVLNRAPEWREIPQEIQVIAGESLQFDLEGSDPDGDKIRFMLDRGELPYRARLENISEGSARFTWQTNVRDVGEFSPVFILTDGIAEVVWEVSVVVEEPVGVGEYGTTQPLAYRLDSPQPNPFNGMTTLGFSLPKSARVKLEVYDTVGKMIVRLADGDFAAGRNTFVWNADALPGGIYLVRLTSHLGIQTAKAVLLK